MNEVFDAATVMKSLSDTTLHELAVHSFSEERRKQARQEIQDRNELLSWGERVLRGRVGPLERVAFEDAWHTYARPRRSCWRRFVDKITGRRLA